MGFAGWAFVTPHAVRQFQRRIDGSLDYDQALGAIIRGLERAGKLKRIPADDKHSEAWKTRVRPNSEYPYAFRAIIAPPENDGDKPSVTTVLRSGT